MTSPEKAAANRENAKKSTGPKSAEGKARSARNAVTHGLTADPGEPTEAYQETLREWIADLKPKEGYFGGAFEALDDIAIAVIQALHRELVHSPRTASSALREGVVLDCS